MSAPNTPIRPRVRQARDSPSATPPSTSTTSASHRRTALSPRSTATASPQVKAALAALRNRSRTPLAESSNFAEPTPSEPVGDAYSTPVKRENPRATQEAVTAEEDAPTEEDDSNDAPPMSLEWKMTDEAAMVERAKRTGRLNLASRGLTTVPSGVYSALIHHSSPFHPSRRRPFDYRTEERFDFSIASAGSSLGEREAEEASAVPWYEQEILKSLNLGNNELEVVGEELGGFEELEFLDLHNNRLSTVPSSLAYLQNLTSLTLSHNRLTSFPLEILYLPSLRELSLAHNELTSLWPVDWRSATKEGVMAMDVSPSATPERVDRFVDLLAPAAMAATQFGAGDVEAAEDAARPLLPNLRLLSLAGNRLGATLNQPDFELPAGLTSLDLSDCGLVDSDIPIEMLGRLLPDLTDLDLSRNQLTDLFPIASSTTSSSSSTGDASDLLFPKLETLHVAVNPIESLEHLEAFLTERVARPLEYRGLSKVCENLVRNQERKEGRRIGVPAVGTAAPARTDEKASLQLASGTLEQSPDLAQASSQRSIKPLEVDVRECFLRQEQARRRALFPPTASSLARERAERLLLARGTKPANNDESDFARPVSPGVPISPTSSTFDPNFVQAQPAASGSPAPATPTRRKPVVLEAWEIEAAAGLSTPAGRRKAAARAAREAEQAEEEKRRREREAAEKQEEEARRRKAEEQADKVVRDKKASDELTDLMRDVKLDGNAGEDRDVPDDADTEGSLDDSIEPPPYSPREATPLPSPAIVSAPPPSCPPTSDSATEEEEQDPAFAMVVSCISRTAGKVSVNLSSRSLDALPRPSHSPARSNELATVTHVDCSRNQLTALPCATLHAWHMAGTLRVLDLSKNRLASLDLLSTASENDLLFPSLEVLHLSSNSLPSLVPIISSSGSTPTADQAPVPLLAALASLAPSLCELRLRQNRLTDVSGIADLVTRRRRRLRILDLGENRIADLEGLCAAADVIIKEDKIKSAWACDELDLSMNEIRQLPPRLGLLPENLILHLIGNAFRFPKREVYEHAGERRVIPWLRERLQA
ncbi:hypothetical protein JCM10908_002519 [Rhodotorula pacifica]|uniref:uncharacterized protein n=1 Tax=Rhodotorula pacifica TaxID=1495444 RepID=UPI00316D5E81